MVRRLFAATLLAGSALCPVTAALAQTAPAVTLIHAGTLLDVPGQAPKKEQTVIVKDGRIDTVKAGYLTPEQAGAPGAATVDLKNGFVMPGLIDCHVHLTQELGPRSLIAGVQDDIEDRALMGAYYAELTLQAGFTTVRDLGAPSRTSTSLRNAFEAGKLPGPSVVASGRVAINAGHGDPGNGWNDTVARAFTRDNENLCNGAEDCRRATRIAIRNDAPDVVKIAVTGGVLSNIAAGTEQQMFDDEIKAVVDTAKLLGKKVAAHAHGKTGIDAALRAGVASIEHGSYLDEGSIELFKKSGAYLVPTLLAGQTVVNAAKAGGTLEPAQRAKALQVGPIMQANFGKAAKAGVKIAFGTDNGVGKHGSNGQEFKLMVDAGMSPAEALKSATVNAAELVERGDRIGTLQPGKDADIIAIKGDPLADITLMQKVDFVMRRGAVHKLNGERQPFAPRA